MESFHKANGLFIDEEYESAIEHYNKALLELVRKTSIYLI